MALRLNGSTSGYAAIDAPAVAGNNTLVLPTGNGTSGQVLSTNGAGTLSWSSVTSSKILQVVNTLKTDAFTTSSTSFVDVTGLSASITPASSSSKILVFASVTLGQPPNNYVLYKLLRGSTDIALSTGATSNASGGFYSQDGASGNTMVGTSVSVLDSPATTSSLTYKIQLQSSPGSGTASINRRAADTAFGGVSYITLMEVAP